MYWVAYLVYLLTPRPPLRAERPPRARGADRHDVLLLQPRALVLRAAAAAVGRMFVVGAGGIDVATVLGAMALERGVKAPTRRVLGEPERTSGTPSPSRPSRPPPGRSRRPRRPARRRATGCRRARRPPRGAGTCPQPRRRRPAGPRGATRWPRP